jgi:hypothetical protein
MTKRQNKLFHVLLVILIPCFSSCKTLIGGGFYPIETADGISIISEPVISGSTIYNELSTLPTVISVMDFDAVETRWFYSFMFRHQYCTFGSFCYNGITQNVKLIYDFNDSASEKDVIGDKVLIKLKGYFWNIDVKGLSSIYEFSTISEEGILQKSSAIDSVYIKKGQLPFIVTSFAIDNKKYYVIIGDADDNAFNVTKEFFYLGPQETTYESGFAGLRNLFRSDKTRYLICDSENRICAEFSLNGYKLYDGDNPELFIPAIGVYLGIFRLMNTH